MNEFIVWDENKEKFIDEKGCVFQDGTLYRNARDFEDMISDDLTMLWSIGKTDINNKKIYADCSVVKMTLTDEDGTHEHIGFFNYNELILCHEFKEPFRDGDMSGNRIWRMEKLQPYSKSFEVIDTTQENKLGLIK